MGVGALLLTGGASRRLGIAKSSLLRDGESLADRGARVLTAVCDPVLEVGPGSSSLPVVREDPPGSGPLSAVNAGAAALRARGHHGPLLVLAVDLPCVETALLGWLAGHPATDSVVPRVAGVAQSLCARYSVEALEVAEHLVAQDERSMRSLLAAVAVVYQDEGEWGAVCDAQAFADVDTLADVERLGLSAPQ